MIEFKISKDTFDKCNKFATDSVGTSTDKYANRNQFDINKIKNDIRNGKIAEQQVFLYFKEKYKDLNSPDFEIYTAKNKNWDHDLKCSSFNLAVKSQELQSTFDFGKSWVFQFGNGNKDCDTGVFKASIEEDKKHFVAFVSLNILARSGKIESVVSIDWLKQHSMFKPMQKESLRSNKLAVYYDDLKQHKDIWQI